MKTKYDKELVKLLEEDFLNELQEEREKWKLKRTSQRFRTRIASHLTNQGNQSLSTSSEI